MSTKAVRQEIVTILTAANTAAGARVYDSKTNPVQGSAGTPCLVVRTAQIDDQNVSCGLPMWRRSYRVAIDGYVSAGADDDLASAGDDLFDEVASALFSNITFVSEYEKISSTSTELGRYADANTRIGGFSMVLSLEYVQTFEPPVEDEFETVEIDTQFTQQYP